MPTRALLATLLLFSLSAAADRPYRGGAVAAAHPLGSAAGKQMLDQGGNAVDAAVAAAFTMAVVGPYHSGLGGGGFAVVHDVKQGDAVLDFREVAPAAATRDMYLREGQPVPALSTDGALSIAVPGAVKGYLELHAKYGKLPRAKVLAPAIRAAAKGFVITPKYRDIAEARRDCLVNDAEAARTFLVKGKDGAWEAPALGTVWKQPDLARTLTALAKSGDAPFYKGALAKAVAATVKEKGGILTADDLKTYKTTWRTPLEGSYRGHKVLTMPPPSAGGLALLQVLSVLEASGPTGPANREVPTLHLTLEALRRAYVDRAKYLGDPGFVDVPVAMLLSKPHLDAWRTSIDPKKATASSALMPTPAPPAPPSKEAKKETKNTTHISVVDEDGNAVAMTTTVNYWFGSCVVAKGTGVLLNDEMDDFASQPGTPNIYGLVTGEANAVAPKKIPLSSMTPTLVFQKERPTEVMLAVGSPGGSTIPTTVLQVVSAVVDLGLDVHSAVALGRVHHQWLPDQVMVDRAGLEPATRKALEAMGHTFKGVPGWGDAEAVFVDPVTGLKHAASDPRNEGAPAGQD